MQAGRLRHEVELQRASVSANAHGGQDRNWSTLATVRALIEPLSGREFLQASQVMSDVNVRIKLQIGRAHV